MFLAPSILSADFGNLRAQVLELQNAGIKYLHIDVMDGNFVPNISFGTPIIKSIRPSTNMIFDVHLMIDKPERYLDDFIASGADIITFHIEATNDVEGIISKLHENNVGASISVRPSTDISVVFPFLDKLDMVLIMTVEPGFGGQSYIKEMNEKIKKLSFEIKKRSLTTKIQIDGGVNSDNINEAVSIGAEIIVAGSSIFAGDSIENNVKKLQNMVNL